MHAGGMINGEMLTNTHQAYKYWRDKGESMFEFDICRTDDGEYVTTHDFKPNYFQKRRIDPIPDTLSAEWFLSQNLFFNDKGPFQAMNLRYILFELLQKHIDQVMLDPKDFTFKGTLLFLDYIAKELNCLKIEPEQIVIELYNPDMIAASRQYPMRVVYQYCVDDDIQQGNSSESRNLPNEDLIDYLNDNGIHVVSYPWKQAVENLPLLKLLIDNDFIVYSRTRNNIFHDLLEQTKISVNIVDEVLTEREMLNLQLYKKKYIAKYQERINDFFL